ncbi:MAG: hypothetical protein K0U61_01605, partial [Alphaproteobacteria bacterium]|nr:hypothetical protein [Alphaproteobacteria bacterium]
MRDDPIITIERILIALIAVLTGVSMYLTMQFGFNSGEEAMGLGLPAVTAAAIALWYIIPGVQNALARRTLLVFALFFSGMDAYTNIGASFAIKENELVGTTNKNEIADNLRNEIATKEDRIKQIQASQAWKSEYTATGAWEAEIKNLEGHFIFKRSKECTDQTLKTTFQHCEKWRSAKAGLANAKARGPLQAEFDALTEQVTKDKASLVDHGGTHVSENATQIERITQLFSFNLQPGEDVKERAYLLMTALLGVVFSIAPAVMSYALRV